MFSVLTFNASLYFIKQLRHSGRVGHLLGTSLNGSETLWVISSIYVDLKFHVHINSSSILYIYTPRSVWLSTGWLLGQLEGHLVMPMGISGCHNRRGHSWLIVSRSQRAVKQPIRPTADICHPSNAISKNLVAFVYFKPLLCFLDLPPSCLHICMY